MLSTGYRRAEIARWLRRAPSTISRKLHRNGRPTGYGSVAAQRKTQIRQSQRPRLRKMARSDVRRYVQHRLRQYWSPDEIAGRSRWSSGDPATAKSSDQTSILQGMGAQLRIAVYYCLARRIASVLRAGKHSGGRPRQPRLESRAATWHHHAGAEVVASLRAG